MSSNTSSPSTNTSDEVPDVENNIEVDDSPNCNSSNRWFFEKEKLRLGTPSRKVGTPPDKELGYRQQAANFIQDVGHCLHLNQLCINTAIVYMNRFYMMHSFWHFNRFDIATASIFLAAKVEDLPRTVEFVIKSAHYCLHHKTLPKLDVKSQKYVELSSELITNENILLQTIGFDLTVDHPHAHVVKCCQLVGANTELAKTSYYIATNSLYLTTMCLEYKPTVVACMCIYVACKWSSWKIPVSKEGKEWFLYVDETVTIEQLESMTKEFLSMVNKAPDQLKRQVLSLNKTSTAHKSLNSLSIDLSTGSKSPAPLNIPKSISLTPADPAKRVNTMEPKGPPQNVANKFHGIPIIPLSPAPHGIKQPESPGSSRTNKRVHPSATKPSNNQNQHGFSIYNVKESQQQLQQTTRSKQSILHGKRPNTPHRVSDRSPHYPHKTGTQKMQSHPSHIHSGQKSQPSSSHWSNVSGSFKKVARSSPSMTPYLKTSKPFETCSSLRKTSTSSGSQSPPAKKICSEVEKPIRVIERIERNSRKQPNQKFY